MMDFLDSAWWLLISLGILVTFHEYGHYWVARRCGVKVLRFSVGFGRAIWSHTARNGTEFQLAMIPLGGYVKMLGERAQDDPANVETDEHNQPFDTRPVWKKMAIIAAGPLANLVLCFALLWLMFVIGRPDYAPIIGQTTAIAAETDLHHGERITHVDGHHVQTWSELQQALLPGAIDRRDVQLTVLDTGDNERPLTLPLSQLAEDFDQRQMTRLIGLWPQHLTVPPEIGNVRKDSPAFGILEEGDQITAIDATPVQTFGDIAPLVQQIGEYGDTIMVEVTRNGERLALPLRPTRLEEQDGNTRWIIGIEPRQDLPTPERDTLQRYNPIIAIGAAARELGHQSEQIFGMLARAFSGKIALKNTVAGPITIARVTSAYASQGLAWYLSILALLSLSLAILNLLPIPLLDGGQLMYYIIELVKGSPVSERVMLTGHYVGMALLATLMGLAFHNDILNLLH